MTNSQEKELSLRWLVILTVSTAIGLVVGWKEGIGAGVMAGIAVAGFLYLAVGG
ncbi:hypothetical protein ACFV4Q_03345 [Streptomyces nojiriensis]|uniref:hypothetical protein n=1 Tax=Streptomyces nojiriensis TaxID=66374 RepID=UPI00365A9520